MLEKAKELACILCFDVTPDKKTELLAEEMGIRLFKGMFQLYIRVSSILTQRIADMICHLFDSFKAYNEEITEAERRDAAPQAVWSCHLKIIAAFCKRDSIILGIDVLDSALRVGTPLAIDAKRERKRLILEKCKLLSTILPFLHVHTIVQHVTGNQLQDF